MAHVIKSVRRFRSRNLESGGWDDRDELVVEIFRTDDGLTATAILSESDHAGLIAEFEAGTSTTILDSACDAWVSSPGMVDSPLTSTQATWKDNYSEP